MLLPQSFPAKAPQGIGVAAPYGHRPRGLLLHSLPQHIAVIMDGNGRWATRRGLPRFMGHRQGANTLTSLIHWCQDLHIPVLTVYGFSAENWQRPAHEVRFLLRLFERLIRSELAKMVQTGVKLRFLGDPTRLPLALQQTMAQAVVATAANDNLHFNIALNYGGRQEILQASRALAQAVELGQISASAITEFHLEEKLHTAGCPAPDLLIRTSGEQRLSNFLLWQLAYTELFFTETLWPDWNRAEFEQILQNYQQRDRRFGRVPFS